MLDQPSVASNSNEQTPLQLQQKDAIAILTLSRPEKRNCLSEVVLLSLKDHLDQIANDRSIHAVVLTAEGPVFSSGHDLKELTARRSDDDGGKAYFRKIMDLCAEVMQLVMTIPQPVIAAVPGTATAAGCQLVASCDLAVASPNAKFCTPGVNIGLFCSTPMVALSRNLSRKHAMEMLLLGEMISAEEAKTYGLVNRVVPAEKVLDDAINMAEKIAAKSTTTVAIGKKAFYAQAEMTVSEAYEYAANVMVENMMKSDAEEGISAFLQKRPPKWTND